MKTLVAASVMTLALVGVSHAQNQGNCLDRIDPNGNFSRVCPGGQPGFPDPQQGFPDAPQTAPVGFPSAPQSSPNGGFPQPPYTAGGPGALPEGWGAATPAAIPPAQSQAAPLPSIIGKWTYKYTEDGNIPAEAIIEFAPNGQYRQFRRFPQTPQLGNQVVQVWGTYTLNGNVLTTTPTGVEVENGTDPHQICNVQTRYCKPIDMPGPQTTQLTPVDQNTIQTPGGLAHRMM